MQGINRIEDVAKLIPPDTAQRVAAKVMAALGSQLDWNSDTLEWVAEAMKPLDGIGGTPRFMDQDDDAIEFWQNL